MNNSLVLQRSFLLVCGGMGSGKTAFATALLEERVRDGGKGIVVTPFPFTHPHIQGYPCDDAGMREVWKELEARISAPPTQELNILFDGDAEAKMDSGNIKKFFQFLLGNARKANVNLIWVGQVSPFGFGTRNLLSSASTHILCEAEIDEDMMAPKPTGYAEIRAEGVETRRLKTSEIIEILA
jgi:CO dehydrogenase nickel-insertion accessory protein CooC1